MPRLRRQKKSVTVVVVVVVVVFVFVGSGILKSTKGRQAAGSKSAFGAIISESKNEYLSGAAVVK